MKAVNAVERLGNLGAALQMLFSNVFQMLDWRNILDITIIAVVIYELIKLMIRTRSSAVLKGVLILVAFAWLTDILQLSVVSWALQQFLNIGVVVLVILFQPELRQALEKLGRSSLITSSPSPASEVSTDKVVSELVTAITDMARKRIGALIVVERKTGLREFADTGTMINADITAPLVENIFEPNTPLHDGAVICRGSTLVAAACFLPLSEETGISRELGTRHRAALGVSTVSDCLVLVVSEETGAISMAHDGKLVRYLDSVALRHLLESIFLKKGIGSLSLGKNQNRRKEGK
jgi:TIGR00159 family protein